MLSIEEKRQKWRKYFAKYAASENGSKVIKRLRKKRYELNKEEYKQRNRKTYIESKTIKAKAKIYESFLRSRGVDPEAIINQNNA